MARRGIKAQTSTAELIALYQAGYSLRQIAQRVNRTHQAVYQRLRLAGVAFRSRGQSKYAAHKHI